MNDRHSWKIFTCKHVVAVIDVIGQSNHMVPKPITSVWYQSLYSAFFQLLWGYYLLH